MHMRTLFVGTGMAVLTIAFAPFVFAAAPEPQPITQDRAAEQRCEGTFGEYRVHCLVFMDQWQA